MLIHNTKKLPARVYRSKDGKKYLPARLMYNGEIGSGYEIKSETGEEITLNGDYNDALIDFQIEGGGYIAPEGISMFEGTLFLDGTPLPSSLPKLCRVNDLCDSVSVKDSQVTFEQKIGGSHAPILDCTKNFLGTSINHVNNFTTWEVKENGFLQRKTGTTDNGYFNQPVYNLTNIVEPDTTYFFYRNTNFNFTITNATSNSFVGCIALFVDGVRVGIAYRWSKYLIFTTPHEFKSIQIYTYTVPKNDIIAEYTEGCDVSKFRLEWTDVGLYPIGKANAPYLGTMTNGGKTDSSGAIALINTGEKFAYPLKTPIITDLTDSEAGQALLEINTEHGRDRILSAPNGIIHARQYAYSEE